MFKLSSVSGALVLSVSIALASTPALAEPASDGAETGRGARAAELNEAGARLYRERQYRQAIEKFIEAYAIDRDANLLFNIARCYEELGDNGAAIEKYTAYMNAPGADAAGRLRAEQSLRALRALARGTKSASPPQPIAGGGESSDGGRGARPAPEEKPAADEPGATSDADSVSLRRTLAWSALGTGALVAGLGATVFYLGMRDHDQVTSSPGYGDPAAANPMTLAEARALVDSGDWKKLAGGIGLGVGGALLVTSAALFVWDGEREGQKRPNTMAFGWVPSAGGFRAAVTVRF
jgi:tetratricopeptide (TPR) repeat protein